MARHPDNGPGLDSVVLLFLFGLLLFLSPFTLWWAASANVWYLPYLLWLVLIVLVARVMRRYRDDV